MDLLERPRPASARRRRSAARAGRCRRRCTSPCTARPAGQRAEAVRRSTGEAGVVAADADGDEVGGRGQPVELGRVGLPGRQSGLRARRSRRSWPSRRWRPGRSAPSGPRRAAWGSCGATAHSRSGRTSCPGCRRCRRSPRLPTRSHRGRRTPGTAASGRRLPAGAAWRTSGTLSGRSPPRRPSGRVRTGLRTVGLRMWAVSEVQRREPAQVTVSGLGQPCSAPRVPDRGLGRRAHDQHDSPRRPRPADRAGDGVVAARVGPGLPRLAADRDVLARSASASTCSSTRSSMLAARLLDADVLAVVGEHAEVPGRRHAAVCTSRWWPSSRAAAGRAPAR